MSSKSNFSNHAPTHPKGEMEEEVRPGKLSLLHSFKPYWVVYAVGLMLFIIGLFDLQPTRFGWSSELLTQGYTLLILGYIVMKVEK